MATSSEASDRWFILKSADAMAARSFSTEEIVEAYEAGTLADRTVVYHRFESRREGLTVKELVQRAKAKAKAKK